MINMFLKDLYRLPVGTKFRFRNHPGYESSLVGMHVYHPYYGHGFTYLDGPNSSFHNALRGQVFFDQLDHDSNTDTDHIRIL